MSNKASTYSVFLSRSAKDKAVLRPLAERLSKDGLRVWLEEWVLKPGESNSGFDTPIWKIKPSHP